MKDETRAWLAYADENMQMAYLAFQHGHLNACLQNAPQVVEKTLKACLVENGTHFPKTHSIRKLEQLLQANGVPARLTEEESDLLDAVYIPSKYPLAGLLPDSLPDPATCERCLSIAERIRKSLEPNANG